jgi:membrane-associated phospholipid phosphatase
MWLVARERASARTQGDRQPGTTRIPCPVLSIATGAVAVVVTVVTGWAATAHGALHQQTDLVTWFNDPPQPIAALFAVVNPFLRPVPLLLVCVAFLAWVLLSARYASRRWEVLRATTIALALAEVMAHVVKHLAKQPRPLAVIPGLDTHGYPRQPLGTAFPSVHTAVVVALISGLWPWLSWPQRAVGLTIAVLVALNRLYIGAHWPIDVIGGGAIGSLAGAIVWLIAWRWPVAGRVH